MFDVSFNFIYENFEKWLILLFTHTNTEVKVKHTTLSLYKPIINYVVLTSLHRYIDHTREGDRRSLRKHTYLYLYQS